MNRVPAVVVDCLRDTAATLIRVRRHPRPVITIIASMAVGIAVSTVILSIVDAVGYRRLPYHDPAELYTVHETPQLGGRPAATVPAALRREWQDRSSATVNLATYGVPGPVEIAAGNATVSGTAADASAGFFRVLGCRVAVGREFEPSETRRPTAPVAIVSYGLWQQMYGGAADVVGRAINVNDVNARTFVIVGVLDRECLFPTSSSVRPDVVLPLDDPDGSNPTERCLMVARLRGGRASPAARVLSSLALDERGTSRRFMLLPLRESLASLPASALLALVGAALFVLFIACINVVNQTLALGVERQHEFAMRRCLGATRGRLVRQILAEVLCQASLAGLVALVLAAGILRLTAASIARALWLFRAPSVDWRLGAIAFLVTVTAGTLAGLVPAWRMSRHRGVAFTLVDPAHAMPRGRWLDAGLVVCQLALCFTPVAAAIVMVHSFARQAQVDLGMDPRHVLVVGLRLPEPARRSPLVASALYEQAVAALRQLPEVAGVATVDFVPLTSAVATTRVRSADRPALQAADVRRVSPDYFDVLHMRYVSGWRMAATDGTEGAQRAVVNQAMARLLSEDGKALGRRLQVDEEAVEVTGIVTDAREMPRSPDAPTVYLPFGNPKYRRFAYRSLLVRVRRDVAGGAAEVGQVLRRVLGDATVTSLRPMTASVEVALARPATYATLFGVLGAAAMLLVVAGTYSVVAHGMACRRREIALRVALGAEPAVMLRRLMGRAALVAAGGLLLGAVGGWAVRRLLSASIEGIVAHDAPMLVAVALLLATLVAAGTYLPARRILSTSAAAVLREQ